MAKELNVSYTDLEQKCILSIPNPRYPSGRRNRAILLLMLRCGLRVSEVVGKAANRKEKIPAGAGGLRLSDVDLESGIIKIRDAKDTRKKRKRDDGTEAARRRTAGRLVKADAETLAALKSWYIIDRERMPGGAAQDSHFFLTRNGRPLTPREVSAMLAGYGRRAEIPQHKRHPHALRKTYASDFIAAGGDSALLKEILGHSSLQVTQRYVQVSDAAVLAAMDKYRPA